MRRNLVWIAAITSVLTVAGTANAQSISCKEFSAGVQKLEGHWDEARAFPGLDLNLGFVMGAYFAATSHSLDEFETSGFVPFLNQLIAKCSTTPQKHVMPTTLDLLKNFHAKSEAVATDDSFIDLIDLKLDIAKMSGKHVTVRGTITILGEIAMLGEGAFDATPIPVEIKKLSREDRKALLKNCQMQCGLTVTGKVGDVLMQKGIIATNVALD